MILDSVNFLIPEATMILTYATYVLAMKQPLNGTCLGVGAYARGLRAFI